MQPKMPQSEYRRTNKGYLAILHQTPPINRMVSDMLYTATRYAPATRMPPFFKRPRLSAPLLKE